MLAAPTIKCDKLPLLLSLGRETWVFQPRGHGHHSILVVPPGVKSPTIHLAPVAVAPARADIRTTVPKGTVAKQPPTVLRQLHIKEAKCSWSPPSLRAGEGASLSTPPLTGLAGRSCSCASQAFPWHLAQGRKRSGTERGCLRGPGEVERGGQAAERLKHHGSKLAGKCNSGHCHVYHRRLHLFLQQGSTMRRPRTRLI
nr:uncharacterized protein LOC118973819 isoform X2 [Manis javanica]